MCIPVWSMRIILYQPIPHYTGLRRQPRVRQVANVKMHRTIRLALISLEATATAYRISNPQYRQGQTKFPITRSTVYHRT